MMQISYLCRFSVAIMMDTEGSEVHTSELEQPMKAEVQHFSPPTFSALCPCFAGSTSVVQRKYRKRIHQRHR